MALYTTPDGRVIVGSGIDNGNDYHGFNGKRDIVIQLTADGATTDGLNALEYLKSYAENSKQENKPIFPDGTRVFISANGYTKAVEADDVVIDGDNITIGGIVWNGSAWDYTNAGQSGGGSGLPTPTANDIGKVATVVNNSGTYEYGLETPSSGGGVLVVTDTDVTLDKTWQEIHDAMLSGGAVINHTNTEGGSFDEVAIITDAFHDVVDGYGISVSAQGSGAIQPVYYSQTADGYPAIG